MPKPRYQLARAFKTARRTSADITCAVTTWGNFDTGLDLVVPFAEVGDVIEVGASGVASNETPFGYLDVATLVSSAVVNTFSTLGAESGASEGISSWMAPQSIYSKISGGGLYTLVAGDIVSGTVTLRLRMRCSTAATKTWLISTNRAFQWWAWNRGGADPN